ncbi:hypothetical protein HY004_01075 [Candidatus Saccharibacteria bacterium]|nr:hypothetical protein [Candidatus Saccharibacteria bacterium]
MVTLTCITTASAAQKGQLDKFGGVASYKSDGSLMPLKYTWRMPGLLVTATLPNGYQADTPTKVVVTYKYLNAKLKEGRKKTTYRKWFGKRKLRRLSVELYSRWWNTGLKSFELLHVKQFPKPVSMGRTRTVTLWVTYPCVQPVDLAFLQPFYGDVAKLPDWKCMPPTLTIKFDAIITRSRPRTFATFSHQISQRGAFVYPAPAATPTAPPPVEPTGPTGPSDPTGPTGPTG